MSDMKVHLTDGDKETALSHTDVDNVTSVKGHGNVPDCSRVALKRAVNGRNFLLVKETKDEIDRWLAAESGH